MSEVLLVWDVCINFVLGWKLLMSFVVLKVSYEFLWGWFIYEALWDCVTYDVVVGNELPNMTSFLGWVIPMTSLWEWVTYDVVVGISCLWRRYGDERCLEIFVWSERYLWIFVECKVSELLWIWKVPMDLCCFERYLRFVRVIGTFFPNS